MANGLEVKVLDVELPSALQRTPRLDKQTLSRAKCQRLFGKRFWVMGGGPPLWGDEEDWHQKEDVVETQMGFQ